MENVLGNCQEIGMNKSERNGTQNFEGDVYGWTYGTGGIWISVSHSNAWKLVSVTSHSK